MFSLAEARAALRESPCDRLSHESNVRSKFLSHWQSAKLSRTQRCATIGHASSALTGESHGIARRLCRFGTAWRRSGLFHWPERRTLLAAAKPDDFSILVLRFPLGGLDPRSEDHGAKNSCWQDRRNGLAVAPSHR